MEVRDRFNSDWISGPATRTPNTQRSQYQLAEHYQQACFGERADAVKFSFNGGGLTVVHPARTGHGIGRWRQFACQKPEQGYQSHG